jgi:hypothetical protein
VEPLPFHKMSSYPYPAAERYPEGPEHARYRREYLTRAAMRLLSPLASHAHAQWPRAGRDSGLYAAK